MTTLTATLTTSMGLTFSLDWKEKKSDRAFNRFSGGEKQWPCMYPSSLPSPPSIRKEGRSARRSWPWTRRSPAGTIRLDDATQEECDAARNVFGRPFSPFPP